MDAMLFAGMKELLSSSRYIFTTLGETKLLIWLGDAEVLHAGAEPAQGAAVY